MTSRRTGALAGIGAPLSFVSAWAVAGARARHYSPVHEFISELARVGAPTRPLMTAGFVGFGVLAPAWARTLAGSLGAPPLRTSVSAAGLGTLAVAAFPLGGAWGDTPHGLAAGVSYIAMASTPMIGAVAFRRTGRSGAARWSWATGIASAALLSGSLLGRDPGLLQRAGLGVVDAWFVTLAVRELRR